MKQKFFELVEANPVIAAVKDETGLEICCGYEEIKVVFILYGNICNIEQIVKKAKDSGKITMIHMDLIEGFSGKESTIDFVKKYTEADGIISTRPSLVRRGKELGLYATLRIFILDSRAFENIQKQLKIVKPDALEILPGVIPKIIHRVSKMTRIPVIAGGLISEKEDAIAALSAGAVSVSTTNMDVWKM